MRLDKWLWTTRFFRHRALATRACDAGCVIAGNTPAKPARTVRIGEILRLGDPGLQRVVRIDRLPEKRLSAGEAAECFTVLETPPENRRAAFIDAILKPS